MAARWRRRALQRGGGAGGSDSDGRSGGTSFVAPWPLLLPCALLLVIGGGFIGVELGQMFARAGVKVTICCRSRLVPEAEPEVSAALAQYLRDEGVTVFEGVGYQKIEKTGKGVALTCETPEGERVIEVEQVLAAK